MQVIGVTGRVQRVFDSGHLRIKFSRLHVWTISAEAVVKVTRAEMHCGGKHLLYSMCVHVHVHILLYIALCFLLFDAQEDFQQFSVGDTVRVTIPEERLAQMFSKSKDFAQCYSLVNVTCN